MTDPSTGASKSQISGYAAAKINLFLHVTGRREDGYHELDSLVAFTAIGDQVSVALAETISLNIDGPFGDGLPVGDDNLVLAAARMFAEEIGYEKGAAITLQKNLPVSSGIGGGSADAAATLHRLNQLWGADLSSGALATIGLRLGADVPACLLSATARMRGIGDMIEPVAPLPRLGVLLINPGVAVSTPQVFKARQGAFSALVDEPVPDDSYKYCEFLRRQKNDLEAPAIELVPVIASVLTVLSGQKGCCLARMSGSGATCFGLFDDEAAAQSARREIAKAHPEWWVQATRFLD